MTTQAPAKPASTTSGTPAKPKVLRIGIIQGGRIVEERLVRTRTDITIGLSAKNTFVIASETLPRSWLLFQETAKGYVAQFADAMDARIAVGNEITSLSQMKQTGKIKKQGQSWPLLLDEKSRGKITMADMTILFQFVTPPPPQPRPQLPASVRGTMTSNLDWFFTSIAAVSFVMHLGVVMYLRSVDWPRKLAPDEIPDRFVQMVVKKKEEKKEEAKKEAKVEKKEEKKKVAEKKDEAPKKELTDAEKAKMAEEKAARDAERRARLAEQVKNTGILKLLGAKADGEGSIADVLGKGDVDRDQEKAFQGVGGLAVATNDSLRGVKTGTGGSGKIASVSGLRGGGGIAGASTGAAAAEKKVSGAVKAEAPAVDGSLDPNLVAKEVRTRIGAIKACYERALKRNPNLSGKIVVHWTITAAGTVSGVDIEQDTIGDSEVASCIKQLVARWRFPSPAGGAVEVSYPFVFQSSQ